MDDELLDDVARRLSPFGPPVSPSEIDDAERRIECRFPTLLREVYLRVGAGSIAHHPHHLRRPSTVASNYVSYRRSDDTGWQWPKSLLPIADWGCGIQACVLVTTDDAEVWWFDPNLDWPEPPEYMAPPWPTGMPLAEWMRAFINGEEFLEHWRPDRRPTYAPRSRSESVRGHPGCLSHD